MANEVSTFIGIELAIGTHDSNDGLMSEGCVPDDVRADAECVVDGMIIIIPICLDGTEAKSTGDEMTNVR